MNRSKNNDIQDKIAFLFLTYDNILHIKQIEKITKNQNIYINPKFLNKINPEYKKYIIPNLITETKWGKISIVYATLELIKEAYKNKLNKWFILLSQDVYPLVSLENIQKKLKNQEKSMFDYNVDNGIYYKTSQWWILNREDIKIILNNYEEFNLIHKEDFKDSLNSTFEAAMDEIYFLSLLKLIFVR